MPFLASQSSSTAKNHFFSGKWESLKIVPAVTVN